MTVKFKNPPINELVIGVYMEPVLQLRAEHIGLYWAEIKSEFPTTRQAPPLSVTPGELVQDEFGFLPRFWFIAGDDTTLVQVQRGAFIFNWRKRADVYPHYESLKLEFDRRLDHFTDFLNREVGVQDLVINATELSYINQISQCSYWRGPEDTSSVIPGITFLQWPGHGMRDFNFRQAHQVADDLLISVVVQNRQSKDSTKNVLHFEIRAQGAIKATSKSQADKWFDRAHAEIGRGFISLTSGEIQHREWQSEAGAHA